MPPSVNTNMIPDKLKALMAHAKLVRTAQKVLSPCPRSASLPRGDPCQSCRPLRWLRATPDGNSELEIFTPTQMERLQVMTGCRMSR